MDQKFIKGEYNNKFELNKWLQYKTCHFFLGEVISRDKIASFDLDYTLIKTKSGKIFAVDENDWEWWDSSIPLKLSELYKQGNHIVIFSNQGEILSNERFNEKRYHQISGKINQVIKSLNIPVLVFMATDFDNFRKPNKKMWDFMIQNCTDGVQSKICDKISANSCYFVGDAAGRPQTPYKPKDFSDSDKIFAQNIGIKFITPDDFFISK